MRVVHVPHGLRVVVDILTERYIVIISSHALVVRDLVQVVNVLVNVEAPLAGVNYLDLLENLHHHLCIHHCVRLLVCQLAAEQEPSLAELVDQRRERKAIIHILFDLGELCEGFDGLLEECLIGIGYSEVLDELGDGQNLKRFRLVLGLLQSGLLAP